MQPLGIEAMNSLSTIFYGGKELSFGTEIIHAKLKYTFFIICVLLRVIYLVLVYVGYLFLFHLRDFIDGQIYCGVPHRLDMRIEMCLYVYLYAS
jgi:hypothetical protein